MVGVKYTTARRGAEKTVNLACQKMGRDAPCTTHLTPLAGGNIEFFDRFLQLADQSRPASLPSASALHLAHHYGSKTPQILRYLDENSQWACPLTNDSPTIQAEVIHAVREEMALTLSDVLCRRTELAAAGLPTHSTLQIVATLMAAELGWSEARKQQVIEDVLQEFRPTLL